MAPYGIVRPFFASKGIQTAHGVQWWMWERTSTSLLFKISLILLITNPVVNTRVSVKSVNQTWFSSDSHSDEVYDTLFIPQTVRGYFMARYWFEMRLGQPMLSSDQHQTRQLSFQRYATKVVCLPKFIFGNCRVHLYLIHTIAQHGLLQFLSMAFWDRFEAKCSFLNEDKEIIAVWS